MTSEIQQQTNSNNSNNSNNNNNNSAMLKTEKLSDYSIQATSSSQPIFHRLATTKLISGVDCDDDYSIAKQQDQQARMNTNSRSSTPFGTNSSDVDQAELFQDIIDNGNTNSTLNNNTDGKHNVGGSVMGIFFKVWSLVKVTKTRSNANKLRRQNSENASQFQYISGEQFNQQQQQQPQSRQFSRQSSPQLLQDRHFRHSSASQIQQQQQQQLSVSPSTSNSIRQPLESLTSTSGSMSNQLQILNNKTPITTTFSGNNNSKSNSTSSGVSSSNSITLASNSTPPPTQQALHSNLNLKSTSNNNQYQAPSNVKRNLSLYSPKKGTTTTTTTTTTQFNAIKQPSTRMTSSEAGKVTSSWASKIKRSATTVNQKEVLSYASRYKFRRSSQLKLQKQQQQQQQQQQQLSLQQQEANVEGLLFANDANNNIDIEDEYFVNDDIDDESNDIYTTPNDSIQSVPSTAPISSNNSFFQQQQAPYNHIDNNNNNIGNKLTNFNPIMKSFSTNSFNNLMKQQQTTKLKSIEVDCFNFQTIQEQQQAASVVSNEIVSNPNDDKKKKDLGYNNKALNGSRFFISSSSSEDSNCPNQQQATSNDKRHKQEVQSKPPSSCSKKTTDKNNNSNNNLKQQQQQDKLVVTVKQGVHYHANSGMIDRPDFLILNNNQQQQSIFEPILMPTTSGVSFVAAMSPIELVQPQLNSNACRFAGVTYKKSPSLFEMSSMLNSQPVVRFAPNLAHLPRFTRFEQQQALSSFKPPSGIDLRAQQEAPLQSGKDESNCNDYLLKNSISFNDSLMNQTKWPKGQVPLRGNEMIDDIDFTKQDDDYRLAEMLLEFGANKSTRDIYGNTALMQAVISDNIAAIKCLIEHKVNLNETNNLGLTPLDLVCNKRPNEVRLNIMRLLIENGANLDSTRECDNTRLLDRLIGEHSLFFQPVPLSSNKENNRWSNNDHYYYYANNNNNKDKLAYIDCLLQNGAKLGSTTWQAAFGKHEIQLRLLRKLSQDGYFLYKQSSIEAAVYRFEYALKRLSELEQQLIHGTCFHICSNNNNNINYNHQRMINSNCQPEHQQILSTKNYQHQQHQLTLSTAKQIKYQVYLGLSRCERKRKFYKRALEFAQMAILIDSTTYEGFYSRAHILKDLKEFDESLLAIQQTARLVDKSIESVQFELEQLQKQEESLIFENCFNILNDSKQTKDWIDATRLELHNNLTYLEEAKRYISKLKAEILDDKLRINIERV